MRLSRMITVVGAHAEGELNEVITGGVLNVPGETMFEKARWLETEGDALRAFLLHEPRGKVSQCTNLVLPSSNPEAAAGYVIIEFCFISADVGQQHHLHRYGASRDWHDSDGRADHFGDSGSARRTY